MNWHFVAYEMRLFTPFSFISLSSWKTVRGWGGRGGGEGWRGRRVEGVEGAADEALICASPGVRAPVRRAALIVDPERHVLLVEPLLLAQPLHPRADHAPLEVLGALVGALLLLACADTVFVLHLHLPLHVGVVGLIVRAAYIIHVRGVVGLVRKVAVPPPAQIEGGAPRVSAQVCTIAGVRGG